MIKGSTAELVQLSLRNKRYYRTKDFLHRASRFVANYCVSNNISTLVIGLNKGWKQDSNIGKVNNQKFVSIPHTILIEQIKSELVHIMH